MKTIVKPWGSEYLLYENDNIAIWHLLINPYKQTSLHSHPNKKTGLVILDGAAKVSFLGGDTKLFYGEKIMIRHGVFHQTKNMTDSVLQLLEIENPVNKNDIVRLDDAYGRAGTSDMGEDGGYISPIDINHCFVGRCEILLRSLTQNDFEYHRSDIDSFIITDGTINSHGYAVASPGDILSYKNLTILVQRFGIENKISGISIKSW
jgi:mannose-6-phosphate isomerase-like protein (cupin superfamily)